jgi:hypothetical protein
MGGRHSPAGRPRLGATIAIGILGSAAAGVWGSAYFLLRPAAQPPVPSPLIEPSPVVSVAPHETLPVFARAGGVRLHLASPKVVAVAFHEASMGDAMPLHPLGICIVCRNRGKFRPPTPEDVELEYLVMDSRGRPQAATSAVDMVMPRDTLLLSPVTGTVVAVKRYRLYYQYPDVRVEIRPDGAPEHSVAVIHLEHVRLEKGDRVEASETPLGTVRRFPFESQVDRYVRGGLPHVHLEVKAPAPRRKDQEG